MSEYPPPAAKQSSFLGLILGLLSIITGGISIFLLGLVFAPIGIIAGLLGAVFSFRKSYTVGGALSIVGIVLAGLGLFTSPSFYWMLASLSFASLFMSKSASTAAVQTQPAWHKEPPAKKIEPPKVIEGEARVVDTSTLMIGGTKVTLKGVLATNREQADTLQDFIRLQGGSVRCDPEGTVYTCRTGQGVDVAEAAILNGAAKAAASAPTNYQQRQAQAKERRAGIWAN
ncbi:MAG: hypothetical protein ACM31L_08510 [Actinomycetota bacterium]